MADIKEDLKALILQREQIEQRIAVCSARLDASGVGLTGPLTDREGYPRADVDVHAARTDRHNIAVLTNDHKALTGRIDSLLQQLHAQNRPQKRPRVDDDLAAHAAPQDGSANGAPPSVASSAQAAHAQPAQPAVEASGRPFAVVDEVSPESPASAAGIRVGDQLVAFGRVSWQDGRSELPAVAAELQANEGHAVQAHFLRQGNLVVLSLTPQRWAGRGLLGCHLRPL